MSTRQLLIGCVFLAGCVVGGVSSQIVAPPARAANTTIPRWEHYCFTTDEDARGALNKAGSEGFELVTTTLERGHPNNSDVIYCMKRPLL